MCRVGHRAHSHIIFSNSLSNTSSPYDFRISSIPPVPDNPTHLTHNVNAPQPSFALGLGNRARARGGDGQPLPDPRHYSIGIVTRRPLPN